MKLPQGLTLQQTQNTWASKIDPILSNLLVQGQLISNINLLTGTNTINHRLDRKLIGWFIVRIKGPAQIYDTQDTNNYPDLTLELTSDANVSVSLWVF